MRSSGGTAAYGETKDEEKRRDERQGTKNEGTRGETAMNGGE